MFLLGFLSIVQIIFLPGILLLGLVKIKTGLVRTLVYSFGLSLTANYCGVLVLTSTGLYNRYVLSFIFVAELILLWKLYRGPIMHFVNGSLANSVTSGLASVEQAFRPFFTTYDPENDSSRLLNIIMNLLNLALIALALLGVLWGLTVFCRHLGSIFNGWDAVISWNRWAVDWFHQELPSKVQHYPQLLPANWSIAYVFINQPLQLFPKAIMPLFFLNILLIMLDLGITKKSRAYLLSIPVGAVLFRQIYGGLIAEGYADIPVAFFAFLSICCLLAAQEITDKKELGSYLLLGAVFSCGGAVTKQAGLYILALYPILAYLLVLKPRADFSRADQTKLLAWFAGLACLIVIPFYLYIQIKINAGLDKSEINFVTNTIFHGKGLAQRLLDAVQLLGQALRGKIMLLLLFLALLPALREKNSRFILGLIAFPYLAIWGLFYSYDIRNISLALPFMALGVGTGLNQLAQYIAHPRRKNYVVIVCLAAALLVLNGYLSSSRLQDRQTTLEKNLFDPVLNQQLYEYQERNGIQGNILTDYIIMGFLPELKDHYRYQFFVKQYGNEYAVYSDNIKKPDITYLLVSDNSEPLILDDIKTNIALGKFTVIFHSRAYTFIKINRGNQ
ncbi:MAG: phospholipid carrier-dependent glycosyltransferase [Syntrophomonas sp.]